jgi:hypothetical protein
LLFFFNQSIIVVQILFHISSVRILGVVEKLSEDKLDELASTGAADDKGV